MTPWKSWLKTSALQRRGRGGSGGGRGNWQSELAAWITQAGFIRELSYTPGNLCAYKEGWCLYGKPK